jgi:small subunit ribosomal protein S1
MADLLSQDEYSYQRPKRGEIRIGTVVLVGPNEIVVDVGAKREGVLSSQDLQRLSAEERAAISVGDEVSVFIVNPEDRDGNTIVSLFLAQIEKDWQKAEEYNESKQLVEETVIGYNKGGLVVPFGRIRGFVPASQVVGFPRRLSPSQKNERLAQQVGRKLAVQIIEVDRRRKRLIMSEQAAQSEWREQQRRKLMDNLVEGQVVRGVVTSLANFGAFVDLGGTDGLIHISELAWHRVRHPREVAQVGDEVDVYVLKLDRVNSKIGLSLRRLLPDPWSLVDTKYFIDQRVIGKITNITDFGAFAHLEDGIEGLIHISELSDTEIDHPGEVVKRGEQYLLEIIKIEPERQRIGLSLKRVSPDEQDVWRASQETSARSETAEPAPSPEPTTALEEETEPDVTAEDESPQGTAPEPELAEAEELTEAESTPSPEPTTALEEETEPDVTAEDESPQGTATAPEPELAEAEELTENDTPPPDDETGSDEIPNDTPPAASEPQPETLAQEPVA